MNTKIIAALAGAVAAVAASGAFAASGVVVSKSVEIKGKTPAQVMEKFGAFCAIGQWHPALAKCEESKEGNDQFRTLHLKDGGAIKEKLSKIGEEGYSYKIVGGPLPVKDYMATFSIKKDDDGDDDVKVSWVASFQAAQGKTEAEAKAVMEGIFDSGLKSLAEMASK